MSQNLYILYTTHTIFFLYFKLTHGNSGTITVKLPSNLPTGLYKISLQEEGRNMYPHHINITQECSKHNVSYFCNILRYSALCCF